VLPSVFRCNAPWMNVHRSATGNAFVRHERGRLLRI
jgi:hypothetical protein